VALQAEHGVLRVEAHVDGVLLLEQHRLEQVGGLLRQDERGAHLVLALRLVLDQLVGVRADEGERGGLQVDVDAVHHGTQLVVGRGEDRLVDAVDERVDIQTQLLALGVELRDGRIAHGTGARNRERAALPADLDLPAGAVDVDCQRQLGKLLQRVEHQLGRGRDRALALDAVDGDRPHERGFEVRGGDLQLVAVELHEEVVENGQRVLIADYLAGRCQERQQGRTGYGEFHGVYRFV